MPRPPRFYFARQFDAFEDIISLYSSASADFPAGDTMNRFGAPLDTIFYIKKGIFKVVALTDGGDELTLCFLGPGSLYPPKRQSFDFSIESFMRFEAATDVEALLIPVDRAEGMFLDHPEIALASIDSRTLELNLMTSRIIQSTLPARENICNFLYLFYVDMDDICLPLSQQDIASMTGTSRIQVSRVYRKLRDEGIIETGHRSINILNADKLHEYCTRLIVP